MNLLPRIASLRIAGSKFILPLAVLAVAGPVVVVSAGFWDAISHILQEPEFFWSAPHIVVYTGVSMTACAGVLGSVLLVRGMVRGSIRTGIKLVMIGGAIQMASGFADFISHDLFGIDGLVSWSHQPLEFGLVLGSLGALLILKGMEYTRLRLLLPFSTVTFLFFVVWLAFNLFLIFGHVIQCIPVYEIFSSGCSVL